MKVQERPVAGPVPRCPCGGLTPPPHCPRAPWEDFCLSERELWLPCDIPALHVNEKEQ